MANINGTSGWSGLGGKSNRLSPERCCERRLPCLHEDARPAATAGGLQSVIRTGRFVWGPARWSVIRRLDCAMQGMVADLCGIWSSALRTSLDKVRPAWSSALSALHWRLCCLIGRCCLLTMIAPLHPCILSLAHHDHFQGEPPQHLRLPLQGLVRLSKLLKSCAHWLTVNSVAAFYRGCDGCPQELRDQAPRA